MLGLLGNLNETEGPRELCEPKYAVEIKGIFIVMMKIMKTVKKAHRISETFQNTVSQQSS